MASDILTKRRQVTCLFMICLFLSAQVHTVIGATSTSITAPSTETVTTKSSATTIASTASTTVAATTTPSASTTAAATTTSSASTTAAATTTPSASTTAAATTTPSASISTSAATTYFSSTTASATTPSSTATTTATTASSILTSTTPTSTATTLSTSTTAATTTTSTTTTAFAGTTTSTASNSTYLISLGLIWNGEDVSADIKRQFETLIYPDIKAACPTSYRINTTRISVDVDQIDALPRIDQVSQLKTGFSAQNFLFMGLKTSTITPLIETVSSNTTVPGYPFMNFHRVAPMSLDLLQSALLKVIKQRINEGLYPKDPANFRAALFIDDSTDITQMTALFNYFNYGLLFYRFSDATIQSALLEVKGQGIINIIVLLPADMGDRLKVVAFQLNMLTYQYRWFLHGPRLVNAPHDTRMTTYSLNITSLEFGRVQDALKKDLRTTSSVLIYDLLSIWKYYLQQYLCSESSPVSTTYYGYSGRFRLYPNGSIERQNWQLQIYRGLEAEREQVGQWSSDNTPPYNMLSKIDPVRTPVDSLKELRKNQFRMVTVPIPPYVMYKPEVSSDYALRDRLTGMYIELCKQIMNDLEITNYDFYLQEDSAFGVFNKSWNGIIRTMMDGRAHLACAPMTIESSRKEVVLFTNVVHSSSQSIIYGAAAADPFAEMFQFLQPLDTYIWLTVLAVLVYVAIVLAIMHWIIPNKGIKLKLYDSLFFSFAEVVQGTSGSVPSQLSGRIVVVFFWFFTLFLLLTYIANYAAFRLLDGVQQQVDSLSTLLQNGAFDFGVVKNTVTVTLLQSSTFVYMQQMYGLLADTFDYGMVDNTSVALRVMQNTSRRYALIGDDLQNKYLSDTNCNLVNTGQFYELKSALVLPPGCEYSNYFNAEIVKLASTIASLQNQFFSVPESLKPDCFDRSFLEYVKKYTPVNVWPVKDGALTLTNTLGIAMINLFGCIFALLLSGVERGFSQVLKKRSEARRRTQVSEAYAMAQRPTMLE